MIDAIGPAALFQLKRMKDKSHMADKTMYTYCGSSANLGDSSLVQFVGCFVKMLCSLFASLFVLLKIGDCDVGLLSCVERQQR